jgi:hypothetical protein
MNKRPLAGIGSLALNGRYWVFAPIRARRAFVGGGLRQGWQQPLTGSRS